MLSGISLLGGFFALSDISPLSMVKILLLGLAAFFLGVHIYLVNDWYGFSVDIQNIERLHRPLLRREISANEGLFLIFGLFFLFLLMCTFLSVKTLFVGFFSSINWLLYSRLRVFFKGTPLSSFLGHLIGGILLFLLGYSAFHNVDMRGVLIGIYFTLVFIGGHLNHEVKDYDVDLEAGMTTSAIKFGKRKVFFSSFAFFSLSTIYFYSLGLRNIVPRNLSLLPLIIYPFYFYFFCSTLRKGISSENICRFRRNYRILYGIMGCMMGFYLVKRLF